MTLPWELLVKHTLQCSRIKMPKSLLHSNPEVFYREDYFPLAHRFLCLSKCNCLQCDKDWELIVILSTPTYICILWNHVLNKGIGTFLWGFWVFWRIYEGGMWMEHRLFLALSSHTPFLTEFTLSRHLSIMQTLYWNPRSVIC